MGLRIAFMGTPECAAPSLRRLLADGHDLLVVCQPDRERGRGRQVEAPPVKLCAEAGTLPLLQPRSINSPEALAALADFTPDLHCVVAFGQILKAEVLALPRLGAVNLHFSLLPRWRGAAPVQHAIWAGDETTGVTTQHMALGVDEGDVILQERVGIAEEETAGELQERLARIGAELLAQTVRLIERGEAPRRPQAPSGVTLARRILPDDGREDFASAARRIARHVHALNPTPGCYASFRGEAVKLWRARALEGAGGPAGSILGVEEDMLVVAAGEGRIGLREVQPAGRGRQTGRDFANGRRVQPGERFGGGTDEGARA